MALGRLSEADRGRVMQLSFGNNGCAFNMARILIGASGFALDAYSLDDTAGDFQLEHFSIDRDQLATLPFLRSWTPRPNVKTATTAGPIPGASVQR